MVIRPPTCITCLKSVRDQVGVRFAGSCCNSSGHSRRTVSHMCKLYRLYLLMDSSVKLRGQFLTNGFIESSISGC